VGFRAGNGRRRSEKVERIAKGRKKKRVRPNIPEGLNTQKGGMKTSRKMQRKDRINMITTMNIRGKNIWGKSLFFSREV